MQPSKMTNDELAAAVSHGAEVSLFMSGNPIYTGVIVPAIEAADKETERDGDWRPGCTVDAIAVALNNSYNSGKKDARRFVVSALERVVRDGEEARRELERREKHGAQR